MQKILFKINIKIKSILKLHKIWIYTNIRFNPKLILSHDYNIISIIITNSFPNHLEAKKIEKLIIGEQYLICFRKNIKTYIKGYEMCLMIKMVNYKLYNNFKSLPISTHH